jgi:hypothetical protein
LFSISTLGFRACFIELQGEKRKVNRFALCPLPFTLLPFTLFYVFDFSHDGFPFFFGKIGLEINGFGE